MEICNKKILITGGLGFIGSNLARRLIGNGNEITLIDSLTPEYGGNLRNIHDITEHVNVNISDVRDSFSILELIKEKDILFNLAGQTSHLDSMSDPITDLDINAKAQLSILEACRLNNPRIRIVFASTRQVYGMPKYLPVDEKHPLNPVDVNGVNKIAGESYHLLYNRIYKIPTCILRLTNTYGPRMRIKDARQTFLGIWIRNIVEKKSISIYGSGAQRRDYNYIDDVVDALLISATQSFAIGKIFNLGSEKSLNLKETAEIMCNFNDDSSYKLVPFPKERKAIDVGDFISDFGLFNSLFQWTPRVSFQDGIKKSIQFYQKELKYYI